ncbi:unnamed protein product [Phytomonas sp. EM1]|nr:unnamed protein product [Phytomonas sp. EM1]|eukprot:CCW63703.1 unnamed protein product [Phytomonas sp. isolate EM1]
MKFNISFITATLLLTQCLGCLTRTVLSLDEVVTSHTLVLTLADQFGTWPTSEDVLESLEYNITDVVCSSLKVDTVSCRAFLTTLEKNALRLYITAETRTLESGSRIHTRLNSWAEKTASPSLDELARVCSIVLGKKLRVLSHITGEYERVPCHGKRTFSLLPVCAPDSVKFTKIYTKDGGKYIENNIITRKRCKNEFEATVFIQIPSTEKIITDSHRNIETAFDTVHKTRKRSNMMALKSTWDARGKPNVEMLTNVAPRPTSYVSGVRILEDIVFPDDNEEFPEPLHCPSSTGLWGLSLIAVVPLLIILFRYSWYLGRKHSKKRERHLIVEDEKRLLNINMPPQADGLAGGDAGAAEADPPQGRDSRDPNEGVVWTIDENGNYHPMSILPERAHSEKSHHTDPMAAAYATGDAQFARILSESALSVGALQAARAGGEHTEGADLSAALQPESDTAQHDPNTADALTSYVYVDPQTGESYQAYVDPNTGEVYTQYVEKDGETGQP